MVFFIGGISKPIFHDYTGKQEDLSSSFQIQNINNSDRFYLSIPSNISFKEVFDYKSLNKLDSGHYKRIVENGYEKMAFDSEHPPAAWPMFPLYPMLIKTFSLITFDKISVDLIGVLLSNLFCFVGLAFFYNYLKLLTKKESSAIFGCILFLSFPTAFYTSLMYTESLFFMLVSISLFYTQKRNWIMAIIPAALLTSTRSSGIFFAIIPAWEYFRTLNFSIVDLIKSKISYLFLLIPIPGLMYFAYMKYLTGSYLAPLYEQRNWGRIAKPFSEFVNYFSDPYFFKVWDLGLITFLLLVSVFVLLPFIYKKLGFGYFVFTLLSIALPLSSGLSSVPRYILSIPTVFIVLTLLLKDRELFRYIILFIFVALQTIYLIAFMNNYYFIA